MSVLRWGLEQWSPTFLLLWTGQCLSRKLIPPGKLDIVYDFTTMLCSVTVINVAKKDDISYAAQYQLIYGPVFGDHWFRALDRILKGVV